MPFCQQHIKAVRCPHPNRWKCTQTPSKAPKTMGEHMRNRRLALHIMQQELADRFGVHRVSVQNWERGMTEPAIGFIPRIIEFLGYDPLPEPDLAHEKIPYARRRLGMTQEELADALEVDPTVIWRWERGDEFPTGETLAAFRLLCDKVGLLNLGAVNAPEGRSPGGRFKKA